MLPIVDGFRNIIFGWLKMGRASDWHPVRCGFNQFNLPHPNSAAGSGRVSDDQLRHLKELVCDYQFPR